MTYFRRSRIIARVYRWCDLFKINKLVGYWTVIVRLPYIEKSNLTLELLDSITIKRWEI